MKYLIFGNGYIGNKLHGFLAQSKISDARINSVKDVEDEIKKHKPEWVINAAGRTGKPNVDWCEDHKEETYFANVTVPIFIAEACKNQNKKMMHVGSGCMYSGDNKGKGFSEEDKPNFTASYYARTKIESERKLKKYDVLQLRIRLPFDEIPEEKNMITKLLRYDKILSVPNSITHLPAFALAAETLMSKNATGIFNITNPGIELHENLLNEYNKHARKSKKFSLIEEQELLTILKTGRSNCVLDTKKLNNEGVFLRDVNEVLSEVLEKYAGLE